VLILKDFKSCFLEVRILNGIGSQADRLAVAKREENVGLRLGTAEMPVLLFENGHGWVDAGIHPQELAGGNDDERGAWAYVACSIGRDGVGGDRQRLIALQQSAESS
jgi:hypothetical protein